MRAKAFVAVDVRRLPHGIVDSVDDRLRIAPCVVAAEQITLQTLTHKILRRPEHLRLCTAKTVNALLGVAHDEHAGRPAGPAITAQPRRQGLPLQGVGVLELVNQEVPHACVQPFLHPARQHRVCQHDQGGALNVIHVDPAPLPLEGGELADQQARQTGHAQLVQPGFMLMTRSSHLQHEILRLPHQCDAHDVFIELARPAPGSEQSRKNRINVTVRHGALQLDPLGRKSRCLGTAQGGGGIIEKLAPGRICQRLVRLLTVGELGVLLGKSLHRNIDQPGSIGQAKLHAFVQRRLQSFFGLRTAPGHDHSFKVGLLRRLLQQGLVKTPPHQGPRLAVVFQQLVIDRQG